MYNWIIQKVYPPKAFEFDLNVWGRKVMKTMNNEKTKSCGPAVSIKGER